MCGRVLTDILPSLQLVCPTQIVSSITIMICYLNDRTNLRIKLFQSQHDIKYGISSTAATLTAHQLHAPTMAILLHAQQILGASSTQPRGTHYTSGIFSSGTIQELQL
jgi:hypothetical protein